MQANYFEKGLPPIGLTQDGLSRVAALVKELLTGDHVRDKKMSYWQFVWSQSKANGCSYHGEDLPQAKWAWPKDTWFQERAESSAQRSRICDTVREDEGKSGKYG